MAGFGRIVLIGATVAVGLGTVAIRAQTVLEDPRNAPKIFASNCSACHKSPQGLAKGLGTASFLRQHYTTGPEMSSAMASYLASVGSPPPAKKGEKKDTKEAAKGAPQKKAEQQVSVMGRPDDPRMPDHRPPAAKQKETKDKDAKDRDAKDRARPATPASSATPQIMAPERGAPAASSPAPNAVTAGLNTPPAQADHASPVAPAAAVPEINLPLPEFPSEPPPEFVQPGAFSSAPLP